MQRYYYSFNEYLQKIFKTRVHRVSLNAGFNCPNRDGTLSSEGCIFCNEKGFANFPKPILTLRQQIEKSINLFRQRFKAEKFIAYFQNSTNTYASSKELKRAYDIIKFFPDIVGLFISTRPDCVDEEKLNLIESYADKYEVWIEYGLQSIHDKSLKKINRSHSFAQFLKIIKESSGKNIKIGAHVILGLPGESYEDMIKTAETLSNLPITGVKIHLLHVLRDTKLETLYNQGKIELLEPSEYVSLVCNFLTHLRPDIVITRLVSNARDEVLVAPKWINRKQEILENINSEFQKRGTYQGIYWVDSNR